jgi:hypothetical protein
MEKDEVILVERHGTGYKVRIGTKKEVTTVNVVSIAIVIIGAIASYIWYLMWL